MDYALKKLAFLSYRVDARARRRWVDGLMHVPGSPTWSTEGGLI